MQQNERISAKLSSIILLSLLLLTFSCNISRYREAQKTDETAKSKLPKADEPDARFDDLKRSKFCADAAEAFWKRNNWKDEKDPLDQSSYTSHYNKSMNECLVDVHGVNLEIEKGKIYESDGIFDALENKSIAGRWQVKKDANPDTEPERYMLIKGGHRVEKGDAASFLPWFETLMTN